MAKKRTTPRIPKKKLHKVQAEAQPMPSEKEQSPLVLTAYDKPFEDAAPSTSPLWELICRPFKIIARKLHF